MKKVLFITSLILIFFSCKKKVPNLLINTAIIVSSEKLVNNTFLHFKSVKFFGKGGNIIESKFRKTNNKIKISFNKIDISQAGVDQPTQAFGVLDLGGLKEKEYKIFFELNKKSTEGLFIINDSATLTIGYNNIIDY